MSYYFKVIQFLKVQLHKHQQQFNFLYKNENIHLKSQSYYSCANISEFYYNLYRKHRRLYPKLTLQIISPYKNA